MGRWRLSGVQRWGLIRIWLKVLDIQWQFHSSLLLSFSFFLFLKSSSSSCPLNFSIPMNSTVLGFCLTVNTIHA